MSEKKLRKTLALPDWAIKKLDVEGDLLGGKPGLVATAALEMFFNASPETKAAYIKIVQDREISEAYNLPSPAKKLAESIVDEALELAKKKKASRAGVK